MHRSRFALGGAGADFGYSLRRSAFYIHELAACRHLETKKMDFLETATKTTKSKCCPWYRHLMRECGTIGSIHLTICVKTEEEIHALMLNQDQLASGIEGNVIISNDCKALMKENIMLRRPAEAQKALCDNSCYATLNEKYKILLDNDCFSKGDSDEEASGRLFAAAYQLACQTAIDGEYCVPMLADLVANADTKYDLCSDSVKGMGCCFQSYRQYMLFGTTASVQALDEAQKTCTADGVKSLDKVCLCANNKHAVNGTTICSGTHDMLTCLTGTEQSFAC